MNILISIIVTILLLLFFYYQDHNKEPIKRLVEAFVIGGVISLQIDYLQNFLMFSSNIFFVAFILAGLIEEGIKLTALRLTLFRNKYFTQSIDGITYAVFLSLGFATVENLILITTLEIGIVRAFTATPAHALFAVAMGYYLGKHKFNRLNKTLFLLALVIPTILHGVYNYLIMSGQWWGLVLFVPYIIFLWALGMFKLNKLKEVKLFDKLDKKLDKK